MFKIGVIHNVNIEQRYFSMKNRKKVEYFYLQNSLIKKFQRYLFVGSFISFEYNGDKRIVDGIEAYPIEHFISIIRKHRFRREVFYDISVIREGIKDFFLSLGNIMFLDVEMTMQSYYSPKNFKPEIIQAGFLITNKEGEDLERKNYYIKPTVFKQINRRTLKFLGLKETVFNNAIGFKDFYNEFKGYLEKYKPFVIVWGKNDILAFKDAYKLNDLKPLTINFVNLLQIHKNYYNLKEDLGLFKAYTMYTGKKYEQDHNAAEDADVTKKVYYEFKQIVCENEE